MKDLKQDRTYEEKVLVARNGWAMLFVTILMFIASIALIVFAAVYEAKSDRADGLFAFLLVSGIVVLIIASIFCGGFKIIKPNEALVTTLFGKYLGTLKKDGFYFVNPFCTAINPAYAPFANINVSSQGLVASSPKKDGSSTSKKISLKTMTLKNDRQKINDLLGNPIEIGVNVIWRINDTAKAVFGVDNYEEYLSIQADSALRNVVRLYPYDIMDDGDETTEEKSLRGSSQIVADDLKKELQEKVLIAGLEIIEVRITHLAYAQEIAAAMLQKQQAVAIIAARQKIVEGAVGMVELALTKLSENDVCTLDDERRAQMVSNLLVVLCANKEAQPIVNSGSLY